MKKFFPLFLFVAFTFTSKAQVSFTLTTPPCHNDGILSASFTGLTTPLTVSWTTTGSAGITLIHTSVTGLTDVLTGYSGGPINISATDALGITQTGSYAGAAPFTICPVVVAGGICPALDTFTGSVCSGGTAPFHYQWYDIATSAIVGTMNPMPVVPGNIYGVIVTDAAGCTYGTEDDITIESFAYVTPTFSTSTTTTTAACVNGTAAVTTSGGGVTPFSYLWSTGATTSTIGSLLMGTYYVTVTDAVGCTSSSYALVPQSITITGPVVPTPASCVASDGTLISFGTGGAAPYTYEWSNGGTTQSQSGLPGGFYTVDVTDANGCIGVDGGYIGNSTPIVTTYTTTPSACISPTGTATLNISGGTVPYSITWYTTPAHTALTATSLMSGDYYYTVTDAAGCEQSGLAFVPPIDVVSASYLSTPAICTASNGNLTAYPAGGVPPYSYSWNTGATTQGITLKPAGVYTVTITDFAGCKATEYPELPVNSPVGLGVISTPSSCMYVNDGIDSAVAWGGTPPYAYGWSSGGTTRTITGLPYGPYWVHVTDANGCTSIDHYSYVDYDSLSTGCYCTLNGTVYNDTNHNCIQDPGDIGIPNVQIQITGGTLGTVYTYTDAMGNYSYRVPSGTYYVSESVLPFYPLSSCQSNNNPVIVVASIGCVNTFNFADSMDTVHDMHISTWDYINPTRGSSYTQVSIISNDGTVTEDSVLATYHTDGQFYKPTFVPAGYFAGTSDYYATDTFTSMAPGTAKQFFMTYNVPANIPFGATALFADTVVALHPTSNYLTDYTPWNNIGAISVPTLASYNPNFKEVSPKGLGSTGLIPYTDSVLEYMVHFQNTGSWPVVNVTVIDTLDNNLDWTSFRPVFSSSPGKITVTQSGTKNIVTYIFADVNLPTQASDNVRSNEFFTYTVHIKPNLPIGTTFRNHASIYFDYNAPLQTNSTINTLSSSSHNAIVNNVTPVNNSFTIYPNPANNSFNAIISSAAASKADLQVSDITGRVMISRNIALQKGAQTIAVDVSLLAPGTYLVSFSSETMTKTQKLVIIK